MHPEPGEWSRDARRSAATAGAGYRERLWVPWWWWPVAAVAAGVIGFEIWLGVLVLDLWLSLAVVGVLTAAVLVWLSRVEIRLADGVLTAGTARLPLRHVAGLEALDRRGARRALGPEGDPTAFVVSRPWIGGALRIVLDDPADPTPYWLISTRRPTELLQAVYDAARATGAERPGRPGQAGSSGPPWPPDYPDG